MKKVLKMVLWLLLIWLFTTVVGYFMFGFSVGSTIIGHFLELFVEAAVAQTNVHYPLG